MFPRLLGTPIFLKSVYSIFKTYYTKIWNIYEKKIVNIIIVLSISGLSNRLTINLLFTCKWGFNEIVINDIKLSWT